MSQLTRTEIKGKFKKGMYPTEQDFGNAFDSYVHKDDMVELEKIVQTIDGEQKALTTIINETKDQAIAAAVEQAVAEIGKTEVPEDLTEFINKVNSFLDDADASDETINKWKEIESFLSGITDTQTLTGLLADLKAEILAETNNVSNKKFCEIIDDLDASDAEVGTIAMYGGPTNDKYTHGFIYEKGEGGEVKAVLESGFRDTYSKVDIPAGEYAFTGETMEHLVDLGTGSYMRMCYQLTGPDGKLYWTTASPDDTDFTWVNIGPDLGTKYGEESRIPYQWQGGASGTIGSSPSWTPLNVMNVIN